MIKYFLYRTADDYFAGFFFSVIPENFTSTLFIYLNSPANLFSGIKKWEKSVRELNDEPIFLDFANENFSFRSTKISEEFIDEIQLDDYRVYQRETLMKKSFTFAQGYSMKTVFFFFFFYHPRNGACRSGLWVSSLKAHTHSRLTIHRTAHSCS